MKLTVIEFQDGGSLRELHKSETGQVSVRIIPPGTSSAGSRHHEKDEKWWIVSGVADIYLEYPGGSTARLIHWGPAYRIIEVPAGTGHKISNYGSDDVVLVWHSSKVYDPENPDRYEWDEKVVA